MRNFLKVNIFWTSIYYQQKNIALVNVLLEEEERINDQQIGWLIEPNIHNLRDTEDDCIPPSLSTETTWAWQQ